MWGAGWLVPHLLWGMMIIANCLCVCVRAHFYYLLISISLDCFSAFFGQFSIYFLCWFLQIAFLFLSSMIYSSHILSFFISHYFDLFSTYLFSLICLFICLLFIYYYYPILVYPVIGGQWIPSGESKFHYFCSSVLIWLIYAPWTLQMNSSSVMPDQAASHLPGTAATSRAQETRENQVHLHAAPGRDRHIRTTTKVGHNYRV